MDDEVKALDPSGCPGGRFTTRLILVDDEATTAATTTTNATVTVALDHGAEFRYLQIYTGSKAGGGPDAVVLEPLSGQVMPG